MTVIIKIRREADKAIREYRDAYPWDGDSIWSLGNYSCDCNRALFFARAIGENDPDDYSCGDEKYAVRIADENGALLYQDDRWVT